MYRRDALMYLALVVWGVKPGYTAELSASKSEEIGFESYTPKGILPAPDSKTFVVRTAEQWAALWNAGKSQYETPPTIDFSKNMLLGVFLGGQPIIERPKVFFTSLRKKSVPDRIEAHYTVVPYKPPPSPRPSLPAYSAMYALILGPVSDLPVHFIETIIE